MVASTRQQQAGGAPQRLKLSVKRIPAYFTGTGRGLPLLLGGDLIGGCVAGLHLIQLDTRSGKIIINITPNVLSLLYWKGNVTTFQSALKSAK